MKKRIFFFENKIPSKKGDNNSPIKETIKEVREDDAMVTIRKKRIKKITNIFDNNLLFSKYNKGIKESNPVEAIRPVVLGFLKTP